MVEGLSLEAPFNKTKQELIIMTEDNFKAMMTEIEEQIYDLNHLLISLAQKDYNRTVKEFKAIIIAIYDSVEEFRLRVVEMSL